MMVGESGNDISRSSNSAPMAGVHFAIFITYPLLLSDTVMTQKRTEREALTATKKPPFGWIAVLRYSMRKVLLVVGARFETATFRS